MKRISPSLHLFRCVQTVYAFVPFPLPSKRTKEGNKGAHTHISSLASHSPDNRRFEKQLRFERFSFIVLAQTMKILRASSSQILIFNRWHLYHEPRHRILGTEPGRGLLPRARNNDNICFPLRFIISFISLD